MRRLVAFLMASMLFLATFPATADTTFSVAWDCSAEGLGEYLSSVGFGETLSSALGNIASTVLSSFHGIITTGNMNHFYLLLDESTLLECALEHRDGEMLLSSTLIPNTSISFPDTLPRDVDWFALAGNDEDAWVRETGRFWGNAYTSGDERFSLHLTSEAISDILLKVNPLLLGGLAEDGAQSLTDFTGELCLVNSHEGVKERLSGISFTLFEGQNTVATLSIGLRPDGMRVVAGVGLASGVYYADCNVHTEDTEDGNILLVFGQLDLYRDPYLMGFEAIEGFEVPFGNAVVSLSIPRSDDFENFACELYLERAGYPLLIQETATSFDEDGNANGWRILSHLPEEETSFLTVTITGTESDLVPASMLSDSTEAIAWHSLLEQPDLIWPAAREGLQKLLPVILRLAPELFAE